MHQLFAPLLDAVRWGEPWELEDDDEDVVPDLAGHTPPSGA